MLDASKGIFISPRSNQAGRGKNIAKRFSEISGVERRDVGK
jgi:hypothetical protein